MAGVEQVKHQPVYIQLNGEQKRLKFDMNSFGELEKRFGSIDKAMESLSEGKLSDIKLILWAGLLHAHVEEFDEESGEPIRYNITPYQVGSGIEMHDLPTISEALAKAMGASLPTEEEMVALAGDKVPTNLPPTLVKA